MGAAPRHLLRQRIAHGKKVDAIIALASVIRGSTPHFDYVAGEVSKGVANVSIAPGVPWENLPNALLTPSGGKLTLRFA